KIAPGRYGGKGRGDEGGLEERIPAAVRETRFQQHWESFVVVRQAPGGRFGYQYPGNAAGDPKPARRGHRAGAAGHHDPLVVAAGHSSTLVAHVFLPFKNVSSTCRDHTGNPAANRCSPYFWRRSRSR